MKEYQKQGENESPYPEYTTIFEENIPGGLKRLDQWVNWRGEWSEDKQKLNKVPKQPSGRAASSTDEETWSPFDKALAAARKKGTKLSGIGLAGLERTPYTGVDLDHCIDPDTGEVNPAAWKIIEAFNSYSEISPSGTGIRIWIEAEKPPTWSASRGGKTEIEVYSQGRFLTVTGRHLEGTPRTIEARQDALDVFMRDHAPAERAQPLKTPYKGASEAGDYVLDLDRFLEEFGVAVKSQTMDTTAERAYKIVCPWVHEHTGGDDSGTRVGQYENGALWFKCDHAHCDGRKWEHFREELDPEAYRRIKFTIGGRKLTEEEEESQKQGRAEAAWADCAELAKSEDILSEIYALQAQDGLIGEQTCAKILQLISVTRYKGQPMSVIVNGESSGGKSYLLKQTVKTLPEDATHILQSISDKALAYIGENTLKNKFLLIYELGGLGKEGEQGIEMVKQLLTEGRIDRQIAESTGKGVQGRRVYAEGPTGLWTTTTKNVVDAELKNRALTLTIDESPAQTERIIKSRSRRKKRSPADFSAVQALHTWLAGQGGDVDIPYEDVIADGVDTRAVRMRRFYDYVMELVEAHALLHRATRVVDEDGYVVAKPEDYAAVYKLVKDIVAVAAEVSVSATQRETVKAARKVVESDKPLTSNTLAEALEISRSSASRRLGAATREGYLRHDPDAKGKTKVYVMGEIKLPESTPAIPAPEDIEVRARAAYDEVCKCAMCARTHAPSDGGEVLSVDKCAEPIAHLVHTSASEENPLSTDLLTYGESKNDESAKKVDLGPPVHTLHTCTDEKNGDENASVHASVHTPLHTSGGDADPLAEGRARRERRRQKRLEAIYDNDPARYHELPINEKINLRTWVSENVAPRQVTRSWWSYGLKHVAERLLGSYVSNPALKGALLEAGYEPVWDDRINMGFRIGPKPGSGWAKAIAKERAKNAR